MARPSCVTDRDRDDAPLDAPLDAPAGDPEFGYRFAADDLQRDRLVIGERRVWRLRSHQRIWSATTRKAGVSPEDSRSRGLDDLVRRRFTADAPDTCG